MDLTGVYEDRYFITDRGDSRIAITLARNEHTVKFDRDTRFIVDDPDVAVKKAYLLTKPLTVGKTYNGKGVFAFVLQEVQSTVDDNMELSIADYYKHYPKYSDSGQVSRQPTGTKTVIDPEHMVDDKERKVWL